MFPVKAKRSNTEETGPWGNLAENESGALCCCHRMQKWPSHCRVQMQPWTLANSTQLRFLTTSTRVLMQRKAFRILDGFKIGDFYVDLFTGTCMYKHVHFSISSLPEILLPRPICLYASRAVSVLRKANCQSRQYSGTNGTPQVMLH